MIVTSCLDCGKIRLTREQVRRQQYEDGLWTCPRCRREAKFLYIPDVVLSLGCLQCKAPVTLASLWDERHVAFFCNPFCVMDHDAAVRGGLKRTANA
jgi:hypothetical protein